MSISQRLYYSHQYLTLPNNFGYSKFNISQYAKKHFVRFRKIRIQNYPKTAYGINNNFMIELFVKNTLDKYKQWQKIKNQKQQQEEKQQQIEKFQKNNNTKIPSNNNILTLAEQHQYSKFVIKKGQPFAILQTLQFDLQLTAPVDMRIIQINYDTSYFNQVLTAPYLFEVQCLNVDQINNLMTEAQYQKSDKFFQTC